MKSRPSLGLGLLYLGLFFGLLSILFFFNRPLIVISNLLIAMGFLFLLGSSKFFLFFRKKFKGSVLYLVGFVFLMFKYDSYSLLKEMSPQFFGLFVQMVGCYFLFEEFLPNLISYLRLTPFNKVLKVPGVRTCVGYVDRKNPHLPS